MINSTFESKKLLFLRGHWKWTMKKMERKYGFHTESMEQTNFVRKYREMRWFVIFMFHVLALYTCLANENCTACQSDFKCCQGLCRPCFNCHLYLRQGGPCVCRLNDCGPCLKGYEEVSKTNFSYTLKACRSKKTKENGTDKCTSDESCPKDKYCFNGRCVSCFNCKLYHREPSRFPCAKYPSDCGSCISGYVEPAVTHYSKLKSCTSKTDYTRGKLLPEKNFLLVLIILIVGSGIFTVFFLRKNHKEALRSNTSAVERPDSYDPVPSSISGEEKIVFTYIREEGEKSNATANVKSSSESVHLPSLDEEVPNSPNGSINYDDEETIPSSWTPNSSVQTPDDNEISFSGIISRIRETKLTGPAEEERGDEKSDNVTSHPDSYVEMDDVETTPQEICVEEDTAKS